ncbi:membrane fusion protein [Sphingomonas sp. BE138]|uniref:HlyD family secretion protein n=1 Tax=Sphingomonas sp. BE138 TaxID=2817845 RepID=UPI002856F4B7|nr:HlyD family efflux transporter periplasmic adaptor subunit [Sphingomonas sp. BE138]MDR6790635.1 membrane fusion protein [Sphingomonas sp. BE138]
MSDSLTRREAGQSSTMRLKGDVHLFNPVSWNIVFLILSVIAGGLFIFAFTVPLSRVVSVNAVILPDRGISSLVAPRGGTLTRLVAAQGGRAERGEVIAIVSTDETSPLGVSNERETEKALQRQLREVNYQLQLVQAKVKNNDARTGNARRSLVATIASLRQQAKLQKELITQGQKSLARAEGLSAKGYVTTSYIDGLRESVLLRQQRAAEIASALSEKEQSLNSVPADEQLSRLEADDSAAVLRARREDLTQQVLKNSLTGSYALRTTVAGTVGNVRYREGEAIKAGATIIDIIPDRSRPVIALKVPSRSITRVKPGQSVRMSVDAMPSVTYGTLRANVISIASTTTLSSTDPGASEYYMAYCAVDFRRSSPRILRTLRANMSGSAAVVTDRLTIANWFLQSFSGRGAN